MSNRESHTLLPNGLLDLLPPHAQAEADAINSFMDVFSSFGYERVKPPLVEFEESLLSEGPGQRLARQTFRLMDPVSQRMMGVRADATAQIARIAATRLSDEARPLRLSYAADILRVNGTQLRPERQFCQVGCEMIGTDSMFADTETPLVALCALSKIGIKGLSVDLTVPTLVQHIYDETSADDDVRAKLDDAIEKRDPDGVAKVGGQAAEIIVRILKARPGFTGVKLPARAAADMDKLVAAADELRKALDIYGLDDVNVTIDLLERRGFEYQTGVSFTLFARDVRGELGRGGRYDVSVRGKAPETATGFTLYMDTILRAAPLPKQGQARSVAADADWQTVKALQDQGIFVTRKA